MAALMDAQQTTRSWSILDHARVVCALLVYAMNFARGERRYYDFGATPRSFLCVFSSGSGLLFPSQVWLGDRRGKDTKEGAGPKSKNRREPG